MKAAVLAVPGDLSTPTGGYVYDRRMRAELELLGWQVDVLNLGDGFPEPETSVHHAAGAALAGLPADRPVVVDGLALGVLPEAAQVLRERHLLVALVHHPLALESGLDPAVSARLRASERAALAAARRVVTTSDATAQLLIADYDVPPDRLAVVKPGTDTPALTLGPRLDPPQAGEGMSVVLLAVGSVVQRKGYDVLIAALATLTALPWRLIIAGDRERSAATTLALERQITQLSLDDRVSLRGALTPSELAPLYSSADVFVLPSRFEGYGMAYAEAMTHGLPVIGTTAGAIPETVPCSAGVLVPADDMPALALALRRLIEDPEERARLGSGARALQFPSWREQGKLFASVLERLQ